MSRDAILRGIYSKKRLIRNFDFDALWHLPIKNYLSEQDVSSLHYLAVSAKYGGMSTKEKLKLMGQILEPRGFKFVSTGTNRAIYRCDFDQAFLLKIAMDDVSVTDSPNEQFNQQCLKPFVPKIFDVTPCGTVEMIERVEPILNRYEFENVAGEIFDIVQNFFLGKYVLEDIGTDFFKNWGIRHGFGPVLLDYPYLYAIDGSKLKCTKKLSNGMECDGYIDYDNGLNTLVCEKCGQRYAAKDLGSSNGIVPVTDKKEDTIMIENFKVGTIIDGKAYETEEVGTDYIDARAVKRQGTHRKAEEFVVTVETTNPEPQVKIDKVEEHHVAEDKTLMGKPIEEHDEKVTHDIKDEKEVVTSHQQVSVGNTVELEEKSEEAAEEESTVTTAVDKAKINKFLKEKCEEFNFNEHTDLGEEKTSLIDFLMLHVITAYTDMDATKASLIVKDYVESNYTYPEKTIDKAEQMAKEYMGDDGYEEMPFGQKIRSRKVRDQL